MPSRDHYRTEVATARLDATPPELAEKMGELAVGSVVIVDETRRPVGIVTDRDLTCRVIAADADVETVRARNFMSQPLVTASPDDPIEHVVERMRAHGIRRIPVVRDDALVGLVSLDDLLVELGRELDDLGEAARRAVEAARRRARRERRRDEIEESFRELRGAVEKAGRDVASFVSREIDAIRERLGRGPRGGT